MPHVSGVILAGGRSRRMGGSPKALVPFGDRPLIRHIVEKLAAVLPDCLVVTNSPELYAFLGLPMVADVFPEGGSLGGIYSGLAAAPGEAALCVACDMPFLSVGLLRHLAERAGEADVVIPDAAGDLQPLHAGYGKAGLPARGGRGGGNEGGGLRGMDARVAGLEIGSIEELNSLPAAVREALYARLAPPAVLPRVGADPRTGSNAAGHQLVPAVAPA